MPTLSLEPLTPKQEQVLTTIERSQIMTGLTPTYREVATLMGRTSPGAMTPLVKSLYRKGYLSKKTGVDDRMFDVVAPVLAPRYIGTLDLFDGSLSLGYPKKIPHCKPWEGCVGLELVRDDEDRCRMEGDILILKPMQGYQGQALDHLCYWGSQPEQMVFGQGPSKASFDLVGLWRDLD